MTFQNPRKPIKLITADQIEPEEVKWLWYPYIPAGTVTALYGRGGMGKSFLTCDIASRLTNGIALPDQEQALPPQKVLMMSAEDDYSKVLIPRLIKQGADRSKIAIPEKQFVLDDWGVNELARMMAEFAATVVFIDPIVYYAGGKMDMNKSNEVRSMMEKLKGAAEVIGSSVIIVGHIRKSQEGGDGDQMMGSADWINASRSSLFVTRTNDGTKVMRHSKTNYGAIGLARAYEVTDEGFIWGEAYDEDGLPQDGSGAPHPRHTQRDAAVSFLRTLLADGPVPAAEVFARAKDEEISVATLNRAKTGVAESVFSRSADTFVWRLVQSDAK